MPRQIIDAVVVFLVNYGLEAGILDRVKRDLNVVHEWLIRTVVKTERTRVNGAAPP